MYVRVGNEQRMYVCRCPPAESLETMMQTAHQGASAEGGLAAEPGFSMGQLEGGGRDWWEGTSIFELYVQAF